MITLFCSAKLSKLLGLKIRLESISLENWNGHLIAIDGRKCLVFVHKDTLYSFVLFDVLKKDLKDFEKSFVTGFLEQLNNDGLLTPAIEDKIRTAYKGLQLSTTDGDRVTIGNINDCVARLKCCNDEMSSLLDSAKEYTSGPYNDCPMGSRKYATGKQLMREYLKALW